MRDNSEQKGVINQSVDFRIFRTVKENLLSPIWLVCDKGIKSSGVIRLEGSKPRKEFIHRTGKRKRRMHDDGGDLPAEYSLHRVPDDPQYLLAAHREEIDRRFIRPQYSFYAQSACIPSIATAADR
jgi:hypothetical protein